MAAVETAAVVLHVLFAGLWVGSVVFYAWGVHPSLAAGDVGAGAADRALSGLQWLTRAGAVVFLATGGYLAGERYEVSSLLGTGEGQLVVAMIGLWLVLTGLVEVVAGRLRRSLDDGVTAAAREARPLVGLAGVVALALLVVGGLVAV